MNSVKEIQVENKKEKTEIVYKKERKEGIELLRILSMFFVLVLHYCDKGGFLAKNLFNSVNSEIAWVFEAFSIVAVNCYILISGYFLINSNYNRKKIIKLIIQVWTYSVIIFAFFCIILEVKFSVKEIFMFVFPTTLKTYWFITCYILLYLLVPYLNNMIKNTTKNELISLICILFSVSFGSSILLGFGYYNVIDITNGYGILWFVVLYCIGAYIKLYEKNTNNTYKYLSLYICLSIFIYCIRVFLLSINPNCIRFSTIFYNYNSITIALSSVCLFLFFKNLQIKNKYIKTMILKVAPLTIAVYIIHEHPIIRNILYKNILHTDIFLHSNKFIIHLLLSCIGIYVACCLIEYIRATISTLIIKTYKKFSITKNTEINLEK